MTYCSEIAYEAEPSTVLVNCAVLLTVLAAARCLWARATAYTARFAVPTSAAVHKPELHEQTPFVVHYVELSALSLPDQIRLTNVSRWIVLFVRPKLLCSTLLVNHCR